MVVVIGQIFKSFFQEDAVVHFKQVEHVWRGVVVTPIYVVNFFITFR